jgi:hypothetical protein
LLALGGFLPKPILQKYFPEIRKIHPKFPDISSFSETEKDKVKRFPVFDYFQFLALRKKGGYWANSFISSPLSRFRQTKPNRFLIAILSSSHMLKAIFHFQIDKRN